MDDIVFLDEEQDAPAPVAAHRAKERIADATPKASDVEMSEATPLASHAAAAAVPDDEPALVLAFPSFSTATYMFDLDRAARVAAKVIHDFLAAHQDENIRLLLVTLDGAAEAAFKKHVGALERFAVVRADISKPKLFGAHVLANATNTTFSVRGRDHPFLIFLLLLLLLLRM